MVSDSAMLRRHASVLVSLSLICASALREEPVTPIEKVISLLEDLKSEIEGEGSSEASSYDDFACFCKTQTDGKSTSILDGRDEIERLSGEIQKNTAQKKELQAEVQDRKTKHEELTSDLESTIAQHEKDEAEYNAVNADLSKAISSLENAKRALSDSKPKSFLAIRESVAQAVALASAMQMIELPKQQAITAFFQQKVDPEDAAYKFHSQGILDLLDKLLVDFRAQHAEVTREWEKTDKTAKDTKTSLNGEINANSGAIDAAESSIENKKGTIASDRTSLVNAEGVLKDDQLYLKDLTVRCESRAADWDQRTQLRNGEVTAITKALDILKNKVQGADESVNKRALLLQRKPVAPHAFVETDVSTKVVSFLQEASASEQTSQMKMDRVVAFLQGEAHRLGSVALSSVAAHASAGPFAKVKELIQKLIERLVKEATAEATKKGFCDEALGKARHDRDYRLADVKKLNVELKGLESKKDELETEIDLLNTTMIELQEALENATDLRATEKKENAATVKEARAGYKAVTEAMIILKVFYKQAGKAKVFLQASPVDEDTDGAGFSGAYKGKQVASKGVIGLLEVIQTDFDRTIRTTEAAEAKSHAEFVLFDRTSKKDIKGKDTKMILDQEDLETTNSKIDEAMEDLQTNMDLMDAALRSLEDLKPTCIDTGMSYADRVAKREEEMEALKRALCILDTNNVEEECAK